MVQFLKDYYATIVRTVDDLKSLLGGIAGKVMCRLYHMVVLGSKIIYINTDGYFNI